MKTAIVLEHTAHEGPERIAHLCQAKGVVVERRRLHEGDELPSRLSGDQILVVMGGPMGVADRDDPRYPYLNQEIALLRRLVDEDAPVLGICLGSQLLACAAGAPVYPNVARNPAGAIAPLPVREVGWAPVDFLAEGKDGDPEGERALAGIGPRAMMLHWHGDTFDLPAGAVRLASTAACLNQAFRLKRRLFGVQFHPELDVATVADWVRADASFVALANGPGGGERILADTTRFMPEAQVVGDRLLGNILEILLHSPPPAE